MPSQPSPLEATRILDEQFLSVRSKLIDLAATLDRLDRAATGENGSSIHNDPRIEQIREALRQLLESGPARTEAIQMLFSLPYNG